MATCPSFTRPALSCEQLPKFLQVVLAEIGNRAGIRRIERQGVVRSRYRSNSHKATAQSSSKGGMAAAFLAGVAGHNLGQVQHSFTAFSTNVARCFCVPKVPYRDRQKQRIIDLPGAKFL